MPQKDTKMPKSDKAVPQWDRLWDVLCPTRNGGSAPIRESNK